MRIAALAVVACACACACQKTTVPSASVDAATPEAGPSPKVEAAKPVLPAFDDRCTIDAECGAIQIHGAGPDACCSMGCAIGKGSKAWIDAVEAACKKAPHPECKDIVCDGPAPPFKPKCKDGRCTLTY